MPEQIGQIARHQADDGYQDDARTENAANRVELARAHVLARKGQARLIEGVHRRVHKAFDVRRRAVARHGDGAEGIDRGLNEHVRNGEDRALETGGQADARQFCQLIAIDADLAPIEVNHAAGTDQADHYQHHGDGLGNDRRPGDARHAHVENGDKDHIQNHVHDARDGEVIQRPARIAHSAQDGRAKVIQHVGDHAGEIDAHIHRSLVQHIRRGIHPDEQLARGCHAEDHYDYAAHQANANGSVHRFAHIRRIARAIIARDDHACAHRQAHKHVHNQVDQRTRRADGGQRRIAHKAPHHDDIRRIVQKLQDTREHQGQRIADDLGHQRAGTHIHLVIGVSALQTQHAAPSLCAGILPRGKPCTASICRGGGRKPARTYISWA